MRENTPKETQRGEGEWSDCDSPLDPCPVIDLAAALGPRLYESFLSFILFGHRGARLTIQRNRDGFSVQVTNAASGREGSPMQMEDFKALKKKLSLMKTGKRKGP